MRVSGVLNKVCTKDRIGKVNQIEIFEKYMQCVSDELVSVPLCEMCNAESHEMIKMKRLLASQCVNQESNFLKFH